MDWTTVRVLTKNLKELLAEIDAGTHVADEAGSTRETWRVGVLAVSSSLLAELSLKEDGRQIHHSWESFSWPGSEQFERNPYLIRAKATLGVAERLLADYDAETKKEQQTIRAT